MSYGYMGKILWVDLDNHTTYYEKVDDETYKQYLTGYGLGAKILFDNIPKGTEALSKDNIIGFMSGILTGTKAMFSGRYCVVGKSPLTNTWGDANSGGYFAPAIKEAGVDGIFFKGKSKDPVYLLIDGGQVSIENTKFNTEQEEEIDLWGQDTVATEKLLKERHGSKFKVACIGKGGERVSLLSGIVTDGGRVAARSGLGALMGSKNLKALCICGSHDVKVFDEKAIIAQNKEFISKFRKYKSPIKDYVVSRLTTTKIGSKLIHYLIKKGKMGLLENEEVDRYVLEKWGTAGVVSFSAETNDSPVKNWKGKAKDDFPVSKSSHISNDAVTDMETKKYGCYCCPLRCGGMMKDKIDGVKLEKVHKPEYETLCGFGTLLESNQLNNIIIINDKLNRAGIDTISCAMTIAWIYELVSEGLINEDKLGILNIQWHDNNGAVQLVDQIIEAVELGKHLRNGIEKSIDGLIEDGYISENGRTRALECGMSIHGQELPMHDPRAVNVVGIGLGIGYEVEPTPGRHTSTLSGADTYLNDAPKDNKKVFHFHPLRNNTVLPQDDEIGEQLMRNSCFMDLINGLGLCAYGIGEGAKLPLVEYINASTGWNYDFKHYFECARRIKTLRHSFNIREGVDVKSIRLPERIRSGIPEYNGNSFDQVKQLYFEAMGYDEDTLKPKKETLIDLDLEFVIKELYEG